MFKLYASGFGNFPRFAALSIILLFMNFISPVPVSANDQPGTGDYRISVDVGLVVLPVVVTDRNGMPVSGLGAANFQVFEDGRPQQIALFESEDVPLTAGLVIDNSGSMAAKRPEVGAAALEFARSSNPQDQMFVVNFNQRVFLGLPKGVAFTSDPGQLLGAATRSPASGNTALYDGLAEALEHMKKGAANRKALILISDGEDNASRLKFRDLLTRAEASNAQIYTLGVFDEMYSGNHSGTALKRLAKATGGQAYFPQSPSEIVTICKQIAHDLRSQYTIGYHPSSANSSGSYHAVRVVVVGPAAGRLHVFTRAGYLMPAEPQTAPPAQVKASL